VKGRKNVNGYTGFLETLKESDFCPPQSLHINPIAHVWDMKGNQTKVSQRNYKLCKNITHRRTGVDSEHSSGVMCT